MPSRFRPRLSYANVVATLALFLALGGGAYAALKLPRNSVGPRQIKANAVNSVKVADRSLLAGLQGGSAPRRGAGRKGRQGRPVPTERSRVQRATGRHGEGIKLQYGCPGGSGVYLALGHEDPPPLAGFGTYSIDGSAPAILDAPAPSGEFTLTGTSRAEFDMTVQARPGKWTGVHLWVIRGAACNVHALVIPPT
jgi:hypothetical protein